MQGIMILAIIGTENRRTLYNLTRHEILTKSVEREM